LRSSRSSRLNLLFILIAHRFGIQKKGNAKIAKTREGTTRRLIEIFSLCPPCGLVVTQCRCGTWLPRQSRNNLIINHFRPRRSVLVFGVLYQGTILKRHANHRQNRSLQKIGRISNAFIMSLLLSFTVSSHAQGGDLRWAKRAGGNNLDEGTGITVDARGSIYTIGYFNSRATFDSDDSNPTVLTAVGKDIFIARYNPSGSLVWVRQITGSAAFPTAIALDIHTNIYITGYFGPSMTFNPGQTNALTLNALANDVFLAKFDSTGNFVWAQQAGGSLSEYAQALAVDGAGNCYITGYYGSNPATFGAGEPNETKLAGLGGNNGEDIFVAKYNTDGMLQWAKNAGGSAGNRGSGIGVDAAGNSYVVGRYSGTSTFGPGEPNQTNLVAPLGGKVEIFIARFNTNGSLSWVRSGQGDASADQGNAIAVDAAGNSVATGTYIGTAPFGGTLNQTQVANTDREDIFVAKHDSDGNLKWVKMAVGNLERGAI
jgi:hypothetical protein